VKSGGGNANDLGSVDAGELADPFDAGTEAPPEAPPLSTMPRKMRNTSPSFLGSPTGKPPEGKTTTSEIKA
jgi:hypothetical protein